MKFTVEIKSSEAGADPVFQGEIDLDPAALGALKAKLLAIRIPTTKPSVDLYITPVGGL